MAATLARLRDCTPAQLESQIASEKREIREGRFTATISAWSKAHQGKIAVLVEAREKRYGGLWDSVSADGFFVDSNGSVEAMPETELWDHGY